MASKRLEQYLKTAGKTRYADAHDLPPFPIHLRQVGVTTRGLSAFDLWDTARVAVLGDGNTLRGVMCRSPRTGCSRTRGPLEFQTEDLDLLDSSEVRLAGGVVLTVEVDRRSAYYTTLRKTATRLERQGDLSLREEWVTEGAPGESVRERGRALRVRIHLKSLRLDYAIREALAIDDALRREAAAVAGIAPDGSGQSSQSAA